MIATIWHELIEHAGPIMGGIAAILAVVIPLWFKIARESKKWKNIYDVSVAGILRSIKLNINHVCKCADEEKLHTLGVTFDGGIFISLPVVIGTAYTPWPGLSLLGISSSPEVTFYTLETSQPTTLVRHEHNGFEERVEVIQGTMYDLDGHKEYKTGETWVIPSGTKHRVRFEAHGIFMCSIRPPLPLARDKPVNVDRLEELEMLT